MFDAIGVYKADKLPRSERTQGIPTGQEPLDQFLLWGGLPKGALALLYGEPGLGSTSLWVHAALNVTQQGRWAVWINKDSQLYPQPLYHHDVDLSRLLVIEAPAEDTKLLWLLQELISSQMFELIGCDLGLRHLKEHQLRKIQRLCRAQHTSLVMFSQSESAFATTMFSLILHFQKNQILIERALHRPVPFSLPRRVSYASFTSYISEPSDSATAELDRPGTGRPPTGALPAP